MSYQQISNPMPITPVSPTGTANLTQEYSGNVDQLVKLMTQILAEIQRTNLLLTSLANYNIEVETNDTSISINNV
jgi:hypothetical protein